MAFGFDPYFTEQNPYLGASSAVIESVAKLVAAGCDFETAYLTFQEYFERLGKDPKRFGKPLCRAAGRVHRTGEPVSRQPSAARTPCPARSTIWTYRPRWFPSQSHRRTLPASSLLSSRRQVIRFTSSMHRTIRTARRITPALKFMWNEVANLIASGKAVSAWALSTGGIAEGVCKMALGNKIGFKMDDSFPADALYLKNFGGILIEAASELPGLLAGRLYHRR